MHKLLYFLIPLIALSCNSKEVSSKEVQLILPPHEAINTVKEYYAPDKRTSHVQIEAYKLNESWVLKGETISAMAKDSLLVLIGDSLKVIDSIVVLPAPPISATPFGVVNVSVCNIRSKPGHSQELATQALLGTPIKIYKRQDNWYWVQTPDDYLGWLDEGAFTKMTSTEYDSWKSKEKIVFIEPHGFAFKEAGIGITPVSDLVAGGQLEKVGDTKGFFAVRFPDGRSAYIAKQKIMLWKEWIATREPSVKNIIRTANTLLGRPYLWGGTSTRAMDCSGFTKTVFYLNGLQLPRDASQQVFTGIKVETDTLLNGVLPGDLLFFGKPATKDKPEKITHVAIYLGAGKFIHSGDGRVQIQSLDRDDPLFIEKRFKTFVQARRLLDQPGANGVEWLH